MFNDHNLSLRSLPDKDPFPAVSKTAFLCLEVIEIRTQ